MAQSQFTLLNQQVLSNPGANANGTYDLYVSSTVQNSIGFPSLRLVIDYANPNPVDIPIPGGISVVVEAMNGAQWFPIAYQFEPYRNADNGARRIIMLQPDISTFDDGIDSIVWVGDATMARISRQQGRVGASFRVRALLKENSYGQPGQFQSVKLSIYGELYNGV